MRDNSKDLVFGVKNIPVGVEYGWKVAEGFIHNTCGQPALTHPDSNYVWGCGKCNMITASPAIYFKPVSTMGVEVKG